MRKRATAAIGLLVVGAVMGGCTGTSGVNTQDLTTPTGSTTVSVPTSSSTTAQSPATAPSTTAAPTSDASSSETPGTEDLSAQEATDRAAIEAQWNKLWQIYAALPHTPEGERQALAAQVAVDPALTNLLTDANTLNSKGWDTYGQFTSRISWPQPVDGKATAVIADCQDASQAGSLETSTGNKTTVGVARNPLQGTFVRGQDGVWRVDQVYYLKDEPC
jgi:hypothetical protein